MQENLQRITEANDAIISNIYKRVYELYYKTKANRSMSLEYIIKSTHQHFATIVFLDAIKIASGEATMDLNVKIIDKYFKSLCKNNNTIN